MLLRYLPPLLGFAGAIAGVVVFTGIKPTPSKALVPFASEQLSVERLSNLNGLKLSEVRQEKRLEIEIQPQSTLAMHSLTGLGAPNWLSDDGSMEYHDVIGTADGGMTEPMKVIVFYSQNAATGYELKATHVSVPIELVSNR